MIKRKAFVFAAIAASAVALTGTGVAITIAPEFQNGLVRQAATTDLTLTANIGDENLVNAATGAEVPITFTADKFEMSGNVQNITKITFNDTKSDQFNIRPGFVISDAADSQIFYENAFKTNDNSAAFGGEGQFATPARIYATPAEGFHFSNVTITYNCEIGGKHTVKPAIKDDMFYLVGDGSFIDPLNKGITYNVLTGIKGEKSGDDFVYKNITLKKGDKIKFVNPAKPENDSTYVFNNLENGCWPLFNKNPFNTAGVNLDCKVNLTLSGGKLLFESADIRNTTVRFVIQDNFSGYNLNEGQNFHIASNLNGWNSRGGNFVKNDNNEYVDEYFCTQKVLEFKITDGTYNKQANSDANEGNIKVTMIGESLTLYVKFSYKEFFTNDKGRVKADVYPASY